MCAGEGGMQLMALIQDIAVDARADEVRAMTQIIDAMRVWKLRSQIGFLCPTGWRQKPNTDWRYIKAMKPSLAL